MNKTTTLRLPVVCAVLGIALVVAGCTGALPADATESELSVADEAQRTVTIADPFAVGHTR